MKPTHFPTAAHFRTWLERHHATVRELSVAFYKKSSGKAGMSYHEAVDEALCFGWIDGIIRRLDDESYCHRFTPRRPGSIWSKINLGHVERLKAAGQMHAAGLAAYARRESAKSGVYSYEQGQPQPRPQKFPTALEKIFRASPSAWCFWQTLPPGHQRTVIHWVTSAKQTATRERRLARLIALAQAGRRLE